METQTPQCNNQEKYQRKFKYACDLQYEFIRLYTFRDWSGLVNKEGLARSGLYYQQRSDHVACFFCRIIIGYWAEYDDPNNEHLKLSPTCPFINNPNRQGNVSLDDENYIDKTLTEYKKSNLSQYQPQIFTPAFDSKKARVGSFRTKNWHNDKIDVEKLADAGFYFIGISDFVKCYKCGGGLFGWNSEDDPKREHCIAYPTCDLSQPHVDHQELQHFSRSKSCGDQQELMYFSNVVDVVSKHPMVEVMLQLNIKRLSILKTLSIMLARGQFPIDIADFLDQVFLECPGDVMVPLEQSRVDSSSTEKSSKTTEQEQPSEPQKEEPSSGPEQEPSSGPEQEPSSGPE